MLSSYFYTQIRAIGRHCCRLKSTLGLMVVCWGLLFVAVPSGEEPAPKWLTAVYAAAKLMLGVGLAHLTLELFPFIRLPELLADYQQARRRGWHPVRTLAAALVYVGSLLAVALVTATILYVMAVW